MQPIKFVSSFSKEGYKLYGKKFVETALKHLPINAELHIYYEEKNPCDIRDKRLVFHNLYKIPGVMDWLGGFGRFPMFRGETHGQSNYRYNAVRFTRKIFAQCDAATNFDGLLFWMDADVVLTGDIDELWLRGLLEEHYMVYMGRPSWHLCASFVGWNCKHKQNAMFWTRYFNLMITGEFAILPEWHDSYILAMMIEGLELDAYDVASQFELGDGPVNVFNTVFDGIGHHLKGNLKKGPQRYNHLREIVSLIRPLSIIEVGTWNGDRAVEMASLSGRLELYVGFDLFDTATAQTDKDEKNVKPHFSAEDVQKKLKDAGVNAHLIKGNTNISMPMWYAQNMDYKADLIFIDGGHAVETIRNDLSYAVKMLKPGGIIVMDDWYENLPDGEIEKFGCNRVLLESSYVYEVLPIKDPIMGGGTTQMVVVDPFDKKGG